MAKKTSAKAARKTTLAKTNRKTAKLKKPRMQDQVAIELRTGTPPDRVAERLHLSPTRLKKVQEKLVNPAAAKRKKK